MVASSLSFTGKSFLIAFTTTASAAATTAAADDNNNTNNGNSNNNVKKTVNLKVIGALVSKHGLIPLLALLEVHKKMYKFIQLMALLRLHLF